MAAGEPMGIESAASMLLQWATGVPVYWRATLIVCPLVWDVMDWCSDWLVIYSPSTQMFSSGQIQLSSGNIGH